MPSITAEELAQIASLVESKLLQGACAKDYAYSRMGLHDEDSEHPSMFIEEVYETYAVSGFMNTSGKYTYNPFKKLQIIR